MLPTDEEIFIADYLPISSTQQKLRDAKNSDDDRRRAKLFLDLAALTKRFINERMGLESRLSARGMSEFSASIYALQWDKIYYAEVKRQEARRALGYWKRLWRALCGR